MDRNSGFTKQTAAELETERLLSAFASGDSAAREALLGIYYAELRRIAHRVVGADQSVLMIQPTEILNEASIKLLKLRDISWQDKAHFFATAARMMRQVLMDQIRRMRSNKREHHAVSVTQIQFESPQQSFDMELLDDALSRLYAVSEEKARIVELRFYGGLTMTEIADVLGISERSVERSWRAARAWLLAALMENHS